MKYKSGNNFFFNHRVAQNKNQKLERKREKQTLSEPT